MSYLNLLSAETWSQVGIVFAAAFYLVECFFGYRLIKYLASIVGFIAGFLIGFFVSAGFYTTDGYVPAIIGIAAGAGLAFVAFKLYLVGVFIFCGGLAVEAVSKLPIGHGDAPGVLYIVLCVAAFVVVGILAVKFSKTCIIIVTSVAGAINAVNVLRTPLVAVDSNMVLRIAVIALIAVAGIMVQRATVRGKK